MQNYHICTTKRTFGWCFTTSCGLAFFLLFMPYILYMFTANTLSAPISEVYTMKQNLTHTSGNYHLGYTCNLDKSSHGEISVVIHPTSCECESLDRCVCEKQCEKQFTSDETYLGGVCDLGSENNITVSIFGDVRNITSEFNFNASAPYYIIVPIAYLVVFVTFLILFCTSICFQNNCTFRPTIDRKLLWKTTRYGTLWFTIFFQGLFCVFRVLLNWLFAPMALDVICAFVFFLHLIFFTFHGIKNRRFYEKYQNFEDEVDEDQEESDVFDDDTDHDQDGSDENEDDELEEF
ncbi:amino acid permease [Anaeramoeba flamelloides]|uniref:Amino acid permease n=1 Tax=Anaeramoeba flamelloides TaxID=1746091 RepID=A0AAV7ZKR6_9EUKA|nr:amino acid permease [Anaeramoeba flamelloides]